MTWSSGHGVVLSLTVVLIGSPRVTPRSPRLAIPSASPPEPWANLAHAPHEPLDCAAGDVEALSPQLPPDLAHAVDLEILGEHTPDLRLERHIPLCPGGQLPWIGPLGRMFMVGGRGIGRSWQIGSTPCASR